MHHLQPVQDYSKQTIFFFSEGVRDKQCHLLLHSTTFRHSLNFECFLAPFLGCKPTMEIQCENITTFTDYILSYTLILIYSGKKGMNRAAR